MLPYIFFAVNEYLLSESFDTCINSFSGGKLLKEKSV